MTDPPERRSRFFAALAVAAAAGTALRLWMLPGQILLDDEWHGLNQVAERTLGGILTNFDAKDNTSLPLNVYHWALLHTAGWSEAGIRFPVIAAGIASLILLPLAARRHLGDRGALFFAFLLAVSPFAVFYSRFSRAYGPVLLLGFLAILAATRWLSTGERRSRRWFLALGLAAAYFHPLAAVTLLAPFAAYAWGALRGGSGAAVPPVEVRKAGVVAAAGLAPLGWAMLTATERLPWGQGEWTAKGLREAATLLAGTTDLPLVLVFFAVAVFGLAALARTSPGGALLARVFIANVAMAGVLLAAARPFGLGSGIVLLRYAIALLPLTLLAVAAGFDALGKRVETQGAGAPGGAVERAARLRMMAAPAAFGLFLALLAVAGPMRWIDRPPNNFTNHSAYQGSYDPPEDSRADARHVYPGYSPGRGEVSEFYAHLASMSGPGAAPGPIVEYPLDITNYNNVFWFYQRVHRREVVAGYCPDGAIVGHRVQPETGQPRLGFLSADQVLSHVADRTKLRFASLVDVTDPAAVAATGARYLVLHKFVMALRFLPGGKTALLPVYYTSVPVLAERWERAAGPPVFEDTSVVCFQLGNR